MKAVKGADSAHFFCFFQAFIQNICGINFGNTAGTQRHDGYQTDAATAKNHGRLADFGIGKLAGVHSNSQRFHQGAFHGRNIVWQMESHAGGMSTVFREDAVPLARDGHKFHMLAKVIMAF